MKSAKSTVSMAGDAGPCRKPPGTKSSVPVTDQVMTIAVSRASPPPSAKNRYLRPAANAFADSLCTTSG
jgi:hypothetical protein